MKNENCFVKTSDWWCGNYYSDGSTFYQRYGMQVKNDSDPNTPTTWDGQEYVNLKLIVANSSNPNYQFVRVSICGNDDTAMHKDFKIEHYDLAKQLYDKLKLVEDITFKILQDNGFDWF